MTTKTKNILTTMHVISWILFVLICVKAGAILFSYIVSIAINPAATQKLYVKLNLMDLHLFNEIHYSIVVLSLVLITALKAFVFYLLIKIFAKINFVHPFSAEVGDLISRISYVAFGISLITIGAKLYCEELIKQGVSIPNLEEYLGGGGEFMLLAGVVFMIAQVFKTGIELQSENALTI